MKTILLAILLLSATSLNAQYVNYKSNGKKIIAVKEETKIDINTSNRTHDFITSNITNGVIATGINLISNAAKNRAELFTATYSASVSKDNNLALSDCEIIVSRNIIEEDKSKSTALIASFSIDRGDNDPDLFKISLDSIFLNYSKAKIINKYKTLDFDFDFTLTGYWREYDWKDSSYTIKKESLGSSKIHITGIQFDTMIKLNNIKSGWFLNIPNPDTRIVHIDPIYATKGGWFTIDLTIKEANPYKMKADKLASFFSDNKDNLKDILQGLISNSSN